MSPEMAPHKVEELRAEGADARSVAVVIPSYKVTRSILGVIDRIGPEVQRIYVVDDCCPDGSGRLVEQRCRDPRVRVLFHDSNRGVGGATMTGYRQAIVDGAEVIVKVDGDGQMDPALIARFVKPILEGGADYTKGNRFYRVEDLRDMPAVRTIGNAVLSFLAKLSTGYWDLLDPTNGFTAVHARVARELPLGKISERYFFESDILFRLNVMRAVVLDVPMTAQYGDEESNLRIQAIIPEFLSKHLRNTVKRLLYNHVIRGFSAATLELLTGVVLLLWGIGFGGAAWYRSFVSGVPATSGTVMVAALPVILGTQLVLGFLNQDVQAVPRQPIHRRL
jgi:glycosyltransferase involved in cell wall biosynthesis